MQGRLHCPSLHSQMLTSPAVGAYIFKPNGTEGTPEPLSFTVVEGPVVSEVHQHWTNYTSLTARCACFVGVSGASRLSGVKQTLQARDLLLAASVSTMQRWPPDAQQTLCPAESVASQMCI